MVSVFKTDLYHESLANSFFINIWVLLKPFPSCHCFAPFFLEPIVVHCFLRVVSVLEFCYVYRGPSEDSKPKTFTAQRGNICHHLYLLPHHILPTVFVIPEFHFLISSLGVCKCTEFHFWLTISIPLKPI